MSKPIWNTPSGLLGTVIEGNPFSFLLSYTDPLGGTIFPQLLSGTLPSGLSLSGASIVGTISLVNQNTNYIFTLRLQNIDGISDRTFSIQVNNTGMSWISPTQIGMRLPNNDIHKSIFDYQLLVSDSNSLVSFKLISGDLPEGLFFENGKIYGYLPPQTLPTKSYSFTVEAKGSGVIQKTFSIIVENFGNVPPLWNSLPGFLDSVETGDSVSIQLKSSDADNIPTVTQTLTYNTTDLLPSALTSNPSGLISGNITTTAIQDFDLTYDVNDSIDTVSRDFFIRVNQEGISPIQWINPPPNSPNPFVFPDLKISDFSWFSVKAESQSGIVFYEIFSGAIPNGLTLNPLTGDIQGTILPSNSLGTYSFVIRAYNSTNQIFYNFEINVISNPTFLPNKSIMLFFGTDKLSFMEDKISLIPYSSIFRPADSNFGINKGIEMILVSDITASVDLDDVFDDFQGYYRDILKPEKFKKSWVLNNIDEVVCECVYLKINDLQDGALDTVSVLENSTIINNTSVDIVRDKLDNLYPYPLTYEKWMNFKWEAKISSNLWYSENHEMRKGQKILFQNQTLPLGFLNNIEYFVIPVDKDNFRLATSLQNVIDYFQIAPQENYINFNINDSGEYSGFFKMFEKGIPFVFTLDNKADFVISLLPTYFDYKMVLDRIIFGPKFESSYDNFQQVIFDNLVTYVHD